jgi:superfamily I DNA/RNA helicase
MLMNAMAVKAQSEDAYAVACEIAMSTGILMYYKGDTSIEGQARTANVEELLNGVKSYVEERQSEIFEEMQAADLVGEGVELSASELPAVTLIDYLENVSLLSAVDVEDEDEE